MTPDPGAALFLDELDHARFLGAFPLVLVQDLLAQAQVMGRGLDVFVDVDVFQRAQSIL